MKICTFEHSGRREAGVVLDGLVVPFSEINAKAGTRFSTDLLGFIESGELEALKQTGFEDDGGIPIAEVQLCLPYPRPPKVWCIGLNYGSHAEDINAVQPDEPGSFMKPGSAIFPPGGTIELPSTEVTKEVDAEGELALVFGKRCRDIPVESVADVLFGFTTTLDLTALDVLARNTRYLQRSKSFDTFFSFGPVITTIDEVEDVTKLEVLTLHNGGVFSRDFVSNMMHRPYPLAAFHSKVFTWEPGDVLSTGCPKGARIQPGDTVGARIEGVGEITASVARRPSGPRIG